MSKVETERSKNQFFVVIDEMTGDTLLDYNPTNMNSCEWEQCELDVDSLEEIKTSARFLTSKEALVVCEKVRKEFLKVHPAHELNFRVHKIEVREDGKVSMRRF